MKVTIPSGVTGLSGSYQFSTAYDPNSGAVARESSPGIRGLPQETVFRSYNTLGRPTESYAANGGGGVGTKLVSQTTYNPYGDVLRINYADPNDPNQVSTTWGYEDGTQRLNSMSAVRATATGQWINNRAYTYTPSGALTKITDTPPGSPADTQCFNYDYLQRLTRAWTPASGDCATAPTAAGLGGAAPYWKDWTYDVAGSRRTETQHATTGDALTTLDYPSPGSARPHAATSATTTTSNGTTNDTYTYDGAGNTLTRTKAGSTHTFTYDIEGHVATATDPAGKVSKYLYDADGNRLIATDPTGTTLSVGDTELFVATGTTTATGTRFYSHGGQQVAVRTTSGLTWKIADHHGTSTASVKASDLSVSRRYQEPFGNPRGTAPATWPDRHGFIGAFQDTTSLVHIGAREYDPAIGRFTTVDPILDLNDPQSWNGYAYANNNPVDHTDPTGLFCDGCGPVSGGIATGWPCADGYCESGSGGKSQEQQAYEDETGTGDGSSQPVIYGHRLPTAKEMKQGPFLGAPVMMGPGETYERAVANWATYICNNGKANPGFCEWSYMVGNRPADGWDIALSLVEGALLAAGTRGVKPRVPIKMSRGWLKGALEAIRSGTVWDDVVATQSATAGMGVLPKSFTLNAGGTKVWVHPNVTEHIGEYTKSLAAAGKFPETVRLATQQQLRSMQAAVAEATRLGVPLNQRMTVGGWQLEFRKSANDELPALIHGRYVG